MPAAVDQIEYLEKRTRPNGTIDVLERTHLDDGGRQINRPMNVPGNTDFPTLATQRTAYWNDILSTNEREQVAETERDAAYEKMKDEVQQRPSAVLETALGMTRAEIARLKERLSHGGR
jgi:hypothetical protein